MESSAEQSDALQKHFMSLPELPLFQQKGHVLPRGRGIIFGLSYAGASNGQVARIAKVDKKTVANVLKRVRPQVDLKPTEHEIMEDEAAEEAEVKADETRTAARKLCVGQIFSQRDDEERYIHLTAATVRLALYEEYKIDVSLRTVERDLLELGAAYRRRPVTAELNTARMHKRLEMIPKMREIARTRKIAFSDESICLAADTHTHQWVRPGEEPEPLRVGRWTARVHLWGCIGQDFKVLVFFTEPRVNAEIYQGMLKKKRVSGSNVVHQYQYCIPTRSKTVTYT